MKKIYPLAIITALLVYKLARPSAAAAGARIFFEPAAATVESGADFTVNVQVDTAGQETMGASASISYPSDLLEVVKVSGGSFYADKATNYDASWIYIDGIQQIPQPVSGSGNLGSIVFRAKKAGTATVTLNCTPGQTNESNILDTKPNDIIDCSANGSGAYKIGKQEQASPTEAPAAPPPAQQPANPPAAQQPPPAQEQQGPLPPTLTPIAELPQSGTVGNTLKTIGVGAGLVIMGAILLL